MSGAPKRWLVTGRVQGVGFRWFVLRRAQSLKLRGFTRNLPDGRVEVVASGDQASLEALHIALESGPTLARVDRVETSEYQHDLSGINSFEVW